MKRIYALLTACLMLVALAVWAQIQPIGIGNAPNDGTGDTLRTAFGKVNNNFSYLTNWSQLATNAFEWRYQAGDSDLTNWSQLATNAFEWRYQAGDATLTNLAGLNSASEGQVIKWTNGAWAVGNDLTGGSEAHYGPFTNLTVFDQICVTNILGTPYGGCGIRLDGTNGLVAADSLAVGATGTNVVSDAGTRLNGVGMTNGWLTGALDGPTEGYAGWFDDFVGPKGWTVWDRANVSVGSGGNASLYMAANTFGNWLLESMPTSPMVLFSTYGNFFPLPMTSSNVVLIEMRCNLPNTTDADRPLYEWGVTTAYSSATYTNHGNLRTAAFCCVSNDLYAVIRYGTSIALTNYLGKYTGWGRFSMLLSPSNIVYATNGVPVYTAPTGVTNTAVVPHLFAYRDVGTNKTYLRFMMDWLRIKMWGGRSWP